MRWGSDGIPHPGGWAGVSPETANQLVLAVQWADLSRAINLISQALPVVPLTGLVGMPGEPQLVMATAVAALDSDGHMRGGVWAAWGHQTRLTTRHKFVLGYLGRVLGLELELETAKAAAERSSAGAAGSSQA
jgi:hypothetical protein